MHDIIQYPIFQTTYLGFGPGNEDSDVIISVAHMAVAAADAADDQLPRQVLARWQGTQLLLSNDAHHLSQNQQTTTQLGVRLQSPGEN